MTKTVDVSKVVSRMKRNKIGHFYVEVEYFYLFNNKYYKMSRILFFTDKKEAKKVRVGYKLAVK